MVCSLLIRSVRAVGLREDHDFGTKETLLCRPLSLAWYSFGRVMAEVTMSPRDISAELAKPSQSEL